ncbi:pyrroline-5-carboxylate reductase ProI [Bacillus sp. PS06]|uniref:pyrroline-5-carboxylate reductase ProI n=1 Tax=Bacillus sp. PS06 TaxID=2764176 RepID=UPI00177EC12B|nr:pyrroline-5-carboxylate reductase ProI [Bacillus sp. PS06]MBD8070356.1 pyrroline-5-carboxylate reductase [Bacillus sp. PS06]
MEKKQQIAFIGAGSMAEAIIAGMLQQKLFNPEQIIVTNRSNEQRLQELHNNYGVQVTHNKQEAMQHADILVLAIKPKDVTEGINEIAPFTNKSQLIISVLAGVSTDTLRHLFDQDLAIVRAMPNTSAAIGKSATALALGEFATDNHLNLVRELFETVGLVSIVEEGALHAVTGLSGSGPAYVYYLVEAMEKAAAEIGLEQEVAKDLILQTIIGAAEMLKSSPKHPSVLRKEVTSPGGTTEAGIKVLESYHYQEAMISCIKQAAKRSNEMGESLEAFVHTKKA